MLAAIRVNGETYSIVSDGALDAKMYNVYIKKILAPASTPEDIVIADNLNVHKAEIAKQLVEERGASYVASPAYSPDLNPREALEKAIASALITITPEDAERWFTPRVFLKC